MLTAILLVSAGCSQNTSVSENGNSVTASETLGAEVNERTEAEIAKETESAVPQGQPAEVQKPEQSEKQKSEEAIMTETISVYYTDPDVMDLLVAKRDISYKDDEEKYVAAFKALQTSGSEDQIPLWGEIELLSVHEDKGAVTIDIHIPDEARLGSGGELFAISALQNTYFQFQEVQTLELLVDGEEAESLMGHVELMHPMTRSES